MKKHDGEIQELTKKLVGDGADVDPSLTACEVGQVQTHQALWESCP